MEFWPSIQWQSIGQYLKYTHTPCHTFCHLPLATLPAPAPASATRESRRKLVEETFGINIWPSFDSFMPQTCRSNLAPESSAIAMPYSGIYIYIYIYYFFTPHTPPSCCSFDASAEAGKKRLQSKKFNNLRRK